MQVKCSGAQPRARLAVPALAATTLALAFAVPWSGLNAGTTPTYRIDFHRISAGGGTARGHCTRLSGTLGQAAPGYSSGSTNSVIAGFWLAAPTDGQDQLFFNGFERC